MVLKRTLTCSFIATLLMAGPVPAFAAEFVISDNGNGTNEIAINTQQQTTVSQTNQAIVQNNVQTSADTGNNTASQNSSGQTSIDTGDVTTSTSVENILNTSAIEKDSCCEQTTELTISGNSNTGDNEVFVTSSSNTSIAVTNTATMLNNIGISANTGFNNSSHNQGTTSISTGSIRVDTTIQNSANNTTMKLSDPGIGSVSLSIRNNTNRGTNIILFDDPRTVAITSINTATLENNVRWDLNTGHNDIIGSIGGASVTTGDILATAKISNTLNDNDVTIPCCAVGGGQTIDDPDEPTDEEGQLPPVDQNQPSNDNSKISSSSVSHGGGSGNGSVLGSSLPSTGTGWWVYATIANILMFLLGLYLRMRAGRSPTRA